MSEMILTILRWTARLAALALAFVYAFMIAGEVTSPHSGPPTHFVEWTGIGLLTLTCLGGLIAWKWELSGALLSLAALGGFLLLVQMPVDIVVFVIATPPALYLLDYLAHTTVAHHHHHG